MKLYLIDASGLVHRAFHAIRGLTNSQGMPTNAIFGLATMLNRFLAQERPTHCAFVQDVGRETFRNRLYQGYKANRPETDPALSVQFKYVPRLASALGFPVVAVPDFEADDVIATLARQAVDAGVDVVIESGDKDLLQLVGPGVTVHDPMKEKYYDREAVFEKLGVHPEFVRDYLALVGDSSDNVPGVHGIGARGAADLINSFGRLEDILKSIDSVPPRARKALEQYADDARLSMKLVTLEDMAPVGVSIGELAMGQPDSGALAGLYSELGFRKLLAELHGAEGTPRVDAGSSTSQGTGPAGPERPAFVEQDLFDAPEADRIQLSADISPKVVEPWRISGILQLLSSVHKEAFFTPWPEASAGFLTDDNQCYIISLSDAARLAPDRLAGAFQDWSGHGFKDLTRFLSPLGIEPSAPSFDPVLAAYVLDAGSGQFGLLDVLERTIHASLPNRADVSPEAISAILLAQRSGNAILRENVAAANLGYLLKDVEIPLAGILGRMEQKGVLVDRQALSDLSHSLGEDLRAVERRIIDAAGVAFNPMSPKQLADVLFVKLGLPAGKKKSSGYSTDVKVLEELAPLHPVPELVLEYRSLSKLKGTYADALYNLVDPADGRIHSTFNQTVTATGRLSSSDPNLQNIPIRTEAGRRIRHAFRAPEGRQFVSADYSQIELRVLAHFAADPFLAEAFASRRDIHSETARRIYRLPAEGEGSQVTPEMRRVAKIVNFGLLYGMGPFRLAGDLKIPQKDARQIIDDYFNAFPGIRDFLSKTVEQTRQTGFSTTLFGRRRGIADINSPNHQLRTAAERMALNMPVQGTAADIIKIAMVNLDRRLKRDGVRAEIVLQVHDELVLEVDNDEVQRAREILISEMENAAALAVPLVAEPGHGTWWDELH